MIWRQTLVHNCASCYQHAFTGCDYTASFFRKGKVKLFEILKKNASFLETFASLNTFLDIENEDVVRSMKEFTCLMHSVKKYVSVNTARLIVFQNVYSRKKMFEPFFQKIKGFDSTSIPPCYRTLRQKILRTIFVSSMWNNATNVECMYL